MGRSDNVFPETTACPQVIDGRVNAERNVTAGFFEFSRHGVTLGTLLAAATLSATTTGCFLLVWMVNVRTFCDRDVLVGAPTVWPNTSGGRRRT